MTAQIHLSPKLDPGALGPASPTYLVPALIAAAGDAAGWHVIDYFTAYVCN